MKCQKFETEKQEIKDFLSLPKMLYKKEENMENEEEVKKLLIGKHPLNKYFHLDKFIIYKDQKPVARFIITTYPKDKTAYLGFFECINDQKVAKFLFDQAYQFCKQKKLHKITGPVDASFWLKYRLKTNLFEKLPYTGEPYNKDYYQQLFLENKYKITNHYTSNIYPAINEKYKNELFDNRLETFKEKGYEITSPDIKDYDKVLEELYELITNLYSDFPIYKGINKEDFKQIFSSYKQILNMNMVKMAYYKKKAVGFFISVPNYQNKPYHLNLKNILKILKIKRKPKEYVMLYMGVLKEHQGLGKAMVGSIMEELRKNNLPSIGALARDGKLTQNYVQELINNRYEYVLLERKIDR